MRRTSSRRASTGAKVACAVRVPRRLAARRHLRIPNRRPLVAHCHLALGKRYKYTGKREQAREYLTTATTMYREMGMTYWLEKAEAEEPRG
jgi:hypothetical protein